MPSPAATLSAVEERMAEPTARGLADAVARAVGEGVLAAGEKLPPIRLVAIELGLSPTTVSAAWNLLSRAGTVHADGRRGTVITARQAGPSRYRSALRGSGGRYALDLSTGTPDPALLPDVTAALRRLRPPAEPATYLDDPVLPELAELLHADWPFAAERITVVDGAMDALQQIAATHLRFGDRVAVEQPCFPPLLDLLDSVGAVPVPVDVDDDGPLPDQLAAVAGSARAVVLQPRAQNPSGAALTRRRVGELARALRGSDALVIEDDSAGAIASTAALSLGSELPDGTLHVRSYSKSHGPDLRLAAIGGAARLVDPVVDRRFLGQGWTSRLLQSLLVDLLTHAPSLRAVERARSAYALRRARIVAALAASGIEVPGRDGLNIWLPVQDEAAALLLLASRGIGAAGGGPFAVRPGSAPHLRVTVGLVASGHRELARHLADASRAASQSVRS
ncbi:MAG TPA: aminotransferase class I/II-fold pyridoxal phosphate-dependent enzyme [Jatrophihabitantaceae bacterium]|nr:aminotransferase class I/II-fold pyridoxal phosphate-dependent enzyme [Jatrophihabitantaceae bacterium]